MAGKQLFEPRKVLILRLKPQTVDWYVFYGQTSNQDPTAQWSGLCLASWHALVEGFNSAPRTPAAKGRELESLRAVKELW